MRNYCLRVVDRMLLLAACLGVSIAGAEDSPVVDRQPIFVAGTHHYHTFRIPSLLVTPRGVVLAFCEGRKSSKSDTGDIDLVLRRSTDAGRGWDALRVIWDAGGDTVGNPCAVADRVSGRVILLLTRNRGSDGQDAIMDGRSTGTRTVWMIHSDDDGQSWSDPVEITTSAKRGDWRWYATGPGIGIQTQAGRLIVPCDHSVAGSRKVYSHVIYSDDHGATWKVGGEVGPDCDECQIAEIDGGTLQLNIRSDHGRNCRYIARSKDGGLTWCEPTPDEALVEPICQAALLRWNPADPTDQRLLFSNPASKRRNHLTVRLSHDGGASWPKSFLLHSGPAAYSCLAHLPDGRVGCLYECGEVAAYERIELATFALDTFVER